jgi:hypothetical protein
MGYKIHTNNTTKPKQSIEFMKKFDYKTLETLILNIASNIHLNNKKNLYNCMDIPSRVNSKKIKSKLPPSFFQFFMATVWTTVATHTMPCLRKKKRGIVSSYLYRGTIATGLVTSSHPSLLMHNSDG